MDNGKAIRGIIVQAIGDSRSREPKGVDFFVDQLQQTIGPEGLLNTYKLAWTKLTELLVILDKAGANVLNAHDILNCMTYLLTSSVCIKDKVSVEA